MRYRRYWVPHLRRSNTEYGGLLAYEKSGGLTINATTTLIPMDDVAMAIAGFDAASVWFDVESSVAGSDALSYGYYRKNWQTGDSPEYWEPPIWVDTAAYADYTSQGVVEMKLNDIRDHSILPILKKGGATSTWKLYRVFVARFRYEGDDPGPTLKADNQVA